MTSTHIDSSTPEALMRSFVAEHCGLVAPARARCHCRKRVATAIALGRVGPAVSAAPSPGAVDAAVAEMEGLYDAAALLRSVPDTVAPDEVAVRIRSLVASGRYPLVTQPSPPKHH